MAEEWKLLRDKFWNIPGTRVQHLLPPAYPPSSFPDYMQRLHDDVAGGAGWDAIQVATSIHVSIVWRVTSASGCVSRFAGISDFRISRQSWRRQHSVVSSRTVQPNRVQRRLFRL
jgi:hypothetical protein